MYEDVIHLQSTCTSFRQNTMTKNLRTFGVRLQNNMSTQNE